MPPIGIFQVFSSSEGVNRNWFYEWAWLTDAPPLHVPQVPPPLAGDWLRGRLPSPTGSAVGVRRGQSGARHGGGSSGAARPAPPCRGPPDRPRRLLPGRQLGAGEALSGGAVARRAHQHPLHGARMREGPAQHPRPRHAPQQGPPPPAAPGWKNKPYNKEKLENATEVLLLSY